MIERKGPKQEKVERRELKQEEGERKGQEEEGEVLRKEHEHENTKRKQQGQEELERKPEQEQHERRWSEQEGKEQVGVESKEREAEDVERRTPGQERKKMEQEEEGRKESQRRPTHLLTRLMRRPSVAGRDTARVFDGARELPLPRCEARTVDGRQESLAWSLVAGYTQRYASDFVLQGTTDANFKTRLVRDLSSATQHVVVDEPVSESVAIVADTDTWSVTQLSCQGERPDEVTEAQLPFARLVADMLESVNELWKLRVPTEFCLMHLEDRLQELYFQSKLVVEYIKSRNYVDLWLDGRLRSLRVMSCRRRPPRHAYRRTVHASPDVSLNIDPPCRTTAAVTATPSFVTAAMSTCIAVVSLTGLR
ncbi:PREDICTED: folliculin-interacting protein 1-like [Priapulus caudatus]|uniref:Folliculin-interacting protein 1-like n=1 Tax=Priapulus caudatus TaxID=37621 RepID=A0ABM1F1G6_PRICU|nr:PREDICTED: folliculin-interacting protein 1-like [Priapulus caudatus]